MSMGFIQMATSVILGTEAARDVVVVGIMQLMLRGIRIIMLQYLD